MNPQVSQVPSTARRGLGIFPLLSACLLLFGVEASAQKVPVTELTLSNGMKLLLVPRHDDPSVSGGWVAHVGSANETVGITGIAHLFEHMMFKGTPTIGTKDYPKDLEIINAQEKVRGEMRAEEVKLRAMQRKGEIEDWQKPESKSVHWKELEKQFDALVKQQRDLMVKDEFDRVYTTAGGSGMNAFTSTDMTAYFITVPANKLELYMWMESERLLHPVFREFYSERDVVFEERRMRTEATPMGRIGEAFEGLVWESHPYGWPTVGWPSDIPSISKAQADAFYSIYYAPQNITLILVGDFDPEQAKSRAEHYFGRIPRGKQDAPDVVTQEIKQAGEKRLYGEADANPSVDIIWHTVPFGHKDSYALRVLAQVLSTKTGRLYKGLVLGSQLGTDVSADQGSRKWAGYFDISGEVREGHTPEELEQGVYAEVEKLKNEVVSDQELQKVKNNFAAGEYRRLGSNSSILHSLMQVEGEGDWREINEAGPKIQAVTPADLQRVAKAYFTKENRSVAIVTRKAGAGEDPELKGLSDQQKKSIGQFATMVSKETDAAKLQQQLQAIDGRLGTADDKSKAYFGLLKKKVETRLQEIGKK